MEPSQSSNNGLTDYAVNEESSPYSLKLGEEQERKLLDLMTENGTYGRTTKIPKATGVRAVLEFAKDSVEFLGVVRMVLARERETRQERRKGAKYRKVVPLSVVLLPEQRRKMSTLTAFCLANGIDCASGTIVRALIEWMEPSPDFTQHLRKVHDKERESWYEKRGLR